MSLLSPLLLEEEEAEQHQQQQPLFGNAEEEEENGNKWRTNGDDGDLLGVPTSCVICLGSLGNAAAGNVWEVFEMPCQRRCSKVHRGCIHEWVRTKTIAGERPTCPLCRGELGETGFRPQMLLPSFEVLSKSMAARREFVTAPLPKGSGMVSCRVRVKKMSMFPNDLAFELSYFGMSEEMMMLQARNSGTKILGRPSYHISLGTGSQDSSSQLIATLKGSYSGMEYSLKSSPDKTELAGISFNQTRIPGKETLRRKIRVCFPNVAPDEPEFENSGNWKTVQSHRSMPLSAHATLLQSQEWHSSFGEEDFQIGYNREPEDLSASPRTRRTQKEIPSRKNFQLTVRNALPTLGSNSFHLRFGRDGPKGKCSEFSMEVQWPLSILQAFGICISACDPKIAVA